jgi:hypothetical protein
MKGRAFRSIASLAAGIVVISLLLLVIVTPVSAGLMYAGCAVTASSRGCSAEAARYTGLALDYATRQRRSVNASAARYKGLAEFYTERVGSRQRAFAAETARYAGLVSAQHLRADHAASARHNALATFHDASFRMRRAESARNQGFALQYVSMGK